MHLTRRAAFAAGVATLAIPSLAFGVASAKRLVVVLLRGGMDGLAAAPPVGDPAYVGARGDLAIDRARALALDSAFALHPRLTNLHAGYGAGETVLVHAASTPYRDRSHFDAQNVLETGGARPYARDAGWLNIALAGLPADARAGRRELGLAVAQQAPLILRGQTSIATWSPSGLPEAAQDTVARLMDLYLHRDPALAGALQSAVAANDIAMESGGAGMGGASGGRYAARALEPLVKAAAGFLKRPDGPVAAVLEMSGGWDTHANQGVEQGGLANNFALLDEGLGALKTEMGGAWRDTAVVVITEFGRTVAPNGNRGCDHGTGAAAFLYGGAIAGGRVLADWPGLAPAQLYQNRDLRPTTDIRAVLKGLLADHLSASSAALALAFPDSADAAPARGLVRG